MLPNINFMDFSKMLDCISEWQTLLSGVLAIAATYLTIRQMKTQHKDNINAKLNAALITAPHAGAEISDFSKDTILNGLC